jgi:predicted amidohydrolase
VLDVVAWEAETRYEHSVNEMSMGPFGRMAMLVKLMNPMPDQPFLFAAPEFFLRDTKTFFQSDQARGEILRALRKLSANFPHVLIMPGTIPWVEEVDSSVCKDLYTAYQKNQRDARYVSKSAEQHHCSLLVHVEKELGRLDSYARVLLARNTLYCLKAGQVVHTYHKRYEAIGLELPEAAVNAAPKAVFFPPQGNSPYFVDDSDGITYGVEICADHEYGGLRAALDRGRVNVHVIVSDEVYPIREHTCADYLVHAGRVIAGVYREKDLPSVDNGDIEGVENILKEKSCAKRTKKAGVLHIVQLPI